MIICSVLFQSICQPLLTQAKTRNPALYQDAICIKRFTLSAPKRFRSSVNIRRATELDRSEGTLEHGRKLSLGRYNAREKTPSIGKKLPNDAGKNIVTPWASANMCTCSHYPGKNALAEGENSRDAGKKYRSFRNIIKRLSLLGMTQQ